jgi:Phage P22-like portal protein
LVNDDLKAATGIYDASLGAKGNETSGVAIARRQQEGDVSNFHFADNLNRSLIHAGKIMLDLIPKIYDSERQIRLMGDDEVTNFAHINAEVPAEDGGVILLHDLSQARFDVRVDIGPSYTTKRIEAVNSMLDYAKSDPQAMPFMRDIFVRNQDWPGADQLADRLSKTISQEVLSDKEKAALTQDPAAPQNQAQQIANQLQLAAAQADIAKKQADTEKARAEAAKAFAEAQSYSINSEAMHAGTLAELGEIQLPQMQQTQALIASVGEGIGGFGEQIAAAIVSGNAELAQAIIAQGQLAANSAAQMAAQMTAQIDQAALVTATEFNKPKRISLERDNRGNLTGAQVEVEGEAEEEK